MRMDRIMNKYIRGTAEVETFRDKGDDKILRWFGHTVEA